MRILNDWIRWLPDAQMVGYAKDSRDGVGANVCDVLIGIIVDDALKSDIAIFDDDVNGLLRTKSITLHHGVAVDGVKNGAANAVVIIRKRQDFDVVDDLSHTLYALYHISGVVLKSGFYDLAREGYFTAVDSVFEVVEDGVIRQ